MSPRLLIYGATGYTGALVSREAIRRGLVPIVAGRNTDKVTALASALEVEGRTFDLTEPEEIARGLTDVSVVLNVAGPFSVTAPPLLAGAIRAGVHYLDTTAELGTFLLTEAANGSARRAGVMVMSGTGWDVVPSDALAARTAARVQDPVSLRLALKIFVGAAGDDIPLLFSRGSTTSALGFAEHAGSSRNDGVLTKDGGSAARSFDFGQGPERATLAPMGDLVTAFTSTGIPNIEVFVAGEVPLPTLPAGTDLPDGPSESDRAIGRARVAAEVTGRDGTIARGLVDTPTGYGFTIQSSVEIAARVLSGDFAPGFHSPASAYGPSILTSIADSHFIDL